MARVALRAGSSKESLYTWFGSKQQLLAELIQEQAASTTSAVRTATTSGWPADQALEAIGVGLLTLLTSPTSLALNRAAMSSPELATILLQHGRHTTGPIVEDYLRRLTLAGDLAVDDAAEAFKVFYGLVVQDTQIRALLGEEPPSAPQVQAQVRSGVDVFVLVYQPARSRS